MKLLVADHIDRIELIITVDCWHNNYDVLITAPNNRVDQGDCVDHISHINTASAAPLIPVLGFFAHYKSITCLLT